MPDAAQFSELLQKVRAEAEEAEVFDDVRVEDGRLVCRARGAAEEAFYRIDNENGTVWVSLVMKDRWLSESIEADLMHTGDKIEDLIDEELADQGFDAGPLAVEHYRSEDLLFTFRSPLPTTEGQSVVQCLLGYEACFRELGDMSEDDDG